MKSIHSPLTIAFVTNNFTPYSGGVVSALLAHTRELQRQGHKVFIITLDFLGAQHNDPVNVIRLFCPIKFDYMNNKMAIPWRPDTQVCMILQEIKADIIHSHHPFLLGESACVAARALGIPIIFTYHSLYHDFAHYVPFSRRITKKIIKRLVSHYCKKVDLITVPNLIIKDMVQAQVPAASITLVPNPIRSEFLQQPIKKVGVSTPCKLLLVSRFVEEKNIPFLLDMFTLLPQTVCTLTLVGYGYAFEQIRSYAYDQLGLSPDRVIFVYKPSHDALLEQYKQADLFVFSSRVDTQGLVMIEAMAFGLPVIALDGPGQRALIKQGINGFIVETAQEMAQKILFILHHRQLYTQLADNAWRTAQDFSPSVITDTLIRLYKNMLSD